MDHLGMTDPTSWKQEEKEDIYLEERENLKEGRTRIDSKKFLRVIKRTLENHDV